MHYGQNDAANSLLRKKNKRSNKEKSKELLYYIVPPIGQRILENRLTYEEEISCNTNLDIQKNAKNNISWPCDDEKAKGNVNEHDSYIKKQTGTA